MGKRWYITLSAALLALVHLNAQEVITGVFNNYSICNTEKKSILKDTKEGSLSLPFFDDFSSGKNSPDNHLWEDNYVFINNTFSDNQYTCGIATFDALDNSGKLYPNASYHVFAADTLTSKPINLEYNPSDSIYLSFLYEPGGLGDSPETNDSLIVQFYSPTELKWFSAWCAKGGGADFFRNSMICITSDKFLKDGFRFRFINYASISSAITEPSKGGNADQWNIDCVKLNKNRTVNDTVMRDVAFTKPIRSLLNNYESMPWNQFKKAYLTAMGSVITLNYRNNDTIIRNVTRGYSITDVYRNIVVNETSAGAVNTTPLSDNSAEESLLYTFSSITPDSALFRIKATLITDDFDPKRNDTIEYYQRFSDFFSYDDGTAEAGYGINGEGSDNAMVALRFRSFTADSVTGIRICLNDAIDNANQRYFYPMAWADDNGKPGEILSEGDEVLAVPSEKNNGFITFHFKKPVFVNGNFWIGWKQTSEAFLNVGLDMNTPHENRLWYSINGNWYESSAPGTILLRAVMKGNGVASSSDDETKKYDSGFIIFPNPVNESFSVQYNGNSQEPFRLFIYNLSGAVVMSADRLTDINISHLPAGSYIVVIRSSEGRQLYVQKIIKSV